jgi:hypothetical protein
LCGGHRIFPAGIGMRRYLLGVDEGAAPHAIRRRPSLRDRLRGPDSYGLLLQMILFSLLLTALVGEGPWSRVAVTASVGTTALFAFWTSRLSSRVLRWATIAVILAVTGSSLAILLGSGNIIDSSSQAIVAVLIASSAIAVARRLLSHQRVQGSTVLGALCIYLVVGFSFAYLFSAVGVISGGFFANQSDAHIVDYLYFSYASLTTVGYGDLSAAKDVGRILAVSEALIGQLYLVTVVAILVSNIGRDRIRRPGRDEADRPE